MTKQDEVSGLRELLRDSMKLNEELESELNGFVELANDNGIPVITSAFSLSGRYNKLKKRVGL